MAGFLQFQGEPPGPGPLSQKGIKTNLNILLEELRSPLARIQGDRHQIDQTDGDMEVGLLTAHPLALLLAGEF